MIQTPTNALGYLFYGAAAAAYSKAGTEDASRWMTLPGPSWNRPWKNCVPFRCPDEPNPAKINWNC